MTFFVVPSRLWCLGQVQALIGRPHLSEEEFRAYLGSQFCKSSASGGLEQIHCPICGAWTDSIFIATTRFVSAFECGECFYPYLLGFDKHEGNIEVCAYTVRLIEKQSFMNVSFSKLDSVDSVCTAKDE